MKIILYLIIFLPFSFHEMGIYDFPAVIEFVTNKTGYSKVDVVGYSLGATIALVGLSEIPEYNENVNKLVLVAPVTRFKSFGFIVSFINQISFLFKVSIQIN